MQIDLIGWVKGGRPSLLGRSYRSGFVLCGLLGFVASWFAATLAAGFPGFLLGWIPSVLVGCLVGFAWPLLLLGATGFAALVFVVPAIQDLTKPSLSSSSTELVVPARYNSAELSQLCSEMAKPDILALIVEHESLVPLLKLELSPSEKDRAQSAVLADVRSRRVLDQVRGVCGLPQLMKPYRFAAAHTSPEGPSRESVLAEMYKRGLLRPEEKSAYEEALRRGLITVQGTQTPETEPVTGSIQLSGPATASCGSANPSACSVEEVVADARRLAGAVSEARTEKVSFCNQLPPAESEATSLLKKSQLDVRLELTVLRALKLVGAARSYCATQ